MNEQQNEYTVLDIRYISETTFIIRFQRCNLQFNTGQYVFVGLKGTKEKREYSIYSGENDPYLEILIKEVDQGLVSKALKKVKIGEHLHVQGPLGYFLINAESQEETPVFIATGTGISPFRSLTRTFPEMNYTLLHGVSHNSESAEVESFNRDNYILCTSQENTGNYQGRVTDRLLTIELNEKANYYLCGNCNMIYDVYDILTARGVNSRNIYTEVYY